MKTVPGGRSVLRRLHEVLFSLNIGFAITFPLLAFVTERKSTSYCTWICLQVLLAPERPKSSRLA